MKKILLFLLLITSVQVLSGIPLSSNFTVNTSLPIEDRMSVADITARNAISSLRRWEGMLVYVVAEGKHYTLVGGITDGEWTELSGSGGGGEMKYLFSSTNSDIAGYESAPSLPSFVAGALVNPGVSVTTTPTILEEFATNLGFPNATVIPAGTFSAHFETQKASGANNYYTYFEVYKRTSGGTETLLATSDNSTTTAVNTIVSTDLEALISSNIAILPTDRLVVKVYAVMVSSSATIDIRYDDNTLSGFTMPSATVDATNFVPYNGAVSDLNLGIRNIIAANYDKDNLLVNGNIENPLSTEWTCTVGTCTRTTMAGQFSKDTAALSVALSAQAMNVSQSVNTPSGIQKQGFARVIYRVPATMADFQICSLVDAAEQTCVPTANLIKDDTFRSIEIPLTFGTTSAGIKFKTTSSYSATAYFDGAIVAQGLGTHNLMTDNVYSATVSAAGVVSGENVDWINGNVSGTNPGIITFKTGIFTVAPNCVGSSTGRIFNIQTTSATTLEVGELTIGGVTNIDQPFRVVCQKSGNDYLASSANVYSASSANYSRTQYTPTFTGFGTVSVHSCYHSRDGGDLLLDCRFTTGTPTATEARVSLPNSLVPDTSVTSIRNYGWWFNANPLVAPGGVGIVSANSYVTFGSGAGGNNGLSALNGNGMSSGAQDTHFFARIPISGWSNSNVIVGSFAGIERCANDYECTDSYSARIANNGTATITSQALDVISSVSRIGAGSVTINLKAGVFTVAPAVTISALDAASSFIGQVLSVSTTSISIETRDNGGTFSLSDKNFAITINKQGVDYKPKTAKVASSIGVPTVPGITTEAIDTFSVSYGTGSAGVVCSASPCSYLDQIGTAVTSITRASTGSYSLVVGKTYTKLKCQVVTNNNYLGNEASCSSCSSVGFVTKGSIGGSNVDSYGTIMCQGTY